MQIINPPSSGASASFFSGFSGNGGIVSTSAFATKGHDFVPSENLSVTQMKAWLSAATPGHSHTATIATVDAAGLIGAVLATSPAVNATGAAAETLTFTFASAVPLVSGTRYILAVSNTSGAGTVPVSAVTGDSTTCQTSLNAPGITSRVTHNYDTTALTAAQVASTTNTDATFLVVPSGTF